MSLRMLSLVLLLMVVSCSKHKDPAKVEPSASPAAVSSNAAEISAPREEPSEEVLRKLEFQVYDEFEKAGGAAMKIQTSEQQATSVPIRAKLFDVRKDKCSPSPIGDGSWYECDLTIRLSLNGGAPGEQGGRIGVKWDSTKGDWVNQ